jgi:hypothetical protein
MTAHVFYEINLKCRIQHRLETSCRGLKTKQLTIQEKHLSYSAFAGALDQYAYRAATT